MNLVPAVAYHFCLNLQAAFMQPGQSHLAESCTQIRDHIFIVWALLRLQKCCRQFEIEVVSNSSDKILLTWEQQFGQALYEFSIMYQQIKCKCRGTIHVSKDLNLNSLPSKDLLKRQICLLEEMMMTGQIIRHHILRNKVAGKRPLSWFLDNQWGDTVCLSSFKGR